MCIEPQPRVAVSVAKGRVAARLFPLEGTLLFFFFLKRLVHSVVPAIDSSILHDSCWNTEGSYRYQHLSARAFAIPVQALDKRLNINVSNL